LSAALRAPDLVGGLVLVATGPRLRVNPRFLQGLVERPEQTLERFVDLWFGPRADTRTRERVREAVRRLGPRVLLQDLKACDAFDVTDKLGSLHLPTLVVAGERDVLTPPRLSQELQAGIRGASLVVLPDAGHMVFLERRRLFRDSVRTFLAGLAPRR
jgi:pimeloyl-ACP methyl ester carboxylesterase